MNATDDEQLYLLAKQPSSTISTFQGYEINGNTFYTFAQDKKSTNQNSGVRFDAADDNGKKVTYYGYIEEIWELEYGPNFKVPLFRCKWFNLKDGVQVDPQYGMTTVDLKNLGLISANLIILSHGFHRISNPREAEALCASNYPCPPGYRVPTGWLLSVGGVPVPPVPLGVAREMAITNHYYFELTPEQRRNPQWHPDYSPTWESFFINRRERALARHEEGGPPPSNFNETGHRLWWRGRTLQGVMAYRGPRLRYPQSQPSSPPSTHAPRALAVAVVHAVEHHTVAAVEHHAVAVAVVRAQHLQACLSSLSARAGRYVLHAGRRTMAPSASLSPCPALARALHAASLVLRLGRRLAGALPASASAPARSRPQGVRPNAEARVHGVEAVQGAPEPLGGADRAVVEAVRQGGRGRRASGARRRRGLGISPERELWERTSVRRLLIW
ncbi:hypothetical protein QYE76_029923 [Lolium multiflorum]|uniref:DUF4216 domain-containing protein n=1 Tax=Lolium multiflorum TaxID=4521 RepID=A0AAD8QPW9_LOLMU|nr:hypothetical protein QYE76_029923 [Lolium multiflorum]